MYHAKDEGRNTFRFFSRDLNARAVERGEFTLCYQPQVGGDARRVVGVEALLRWNHPTRSGLAPECLALEITEGVLMADREIVSANLRRLRAMGVRRSLDDFGTGYSSLSYLKRLPRTSSRSTSPSRRTSSGTWTAPPSSPPSSPSAARSTWT